MSPLCSLGVRHEHFLLFWCFALFVLVCFSISHDFHPARLFLSHYSLLRLEALRDEQPGAVPPAVVMLQPADTGLQVSQRNVVVQRE